MIDLEKMVQTSLRGMADSGKIVEIVDKHAEQLVNSVVRDALATYSDFGKSLSKALGDSLRVDVNSIGLPQYNALVLEIVRRQLGKSLEQSGRQQLEKNMEALLASEAPKEIKITKLIEDFKKWVVEDDKSRRGREITAFVEPTEYGSFWISLDPKGDQTRHMCRFRLLVNEDTGALATAWLSGVDTSKALFLGGLYGFERDLFQMWTVKTRIVIDAKEFDLYLPDEEF